MKIYCRLYEPKYIFRLHILKILCNSYCISRIYNWKCIFRFRNTLHV